MPAQFELKPAKNGSFFFNLLAANGEVVLTSQMYKSKETARKGIASVRNNGGEAEQFEDRVTKAGKHYFVLKAKNRQVIGTSQSYSNVAAMKKGKQSVIKNAENAK